MAWLFLKWNSSLGVGFPTLLIYIRGQGSAKEVVIMRWKHPPWIHRILPPLPFYTQDVGIDLKKKRGIQSFSAFHRVQLLLTHRTIPFCLDPNQLASRRSFSSLHVSSMHAYSIPLSDSQRSLNLRKREKINISSREEKNHESRFRRIINLTLLSSCNSLNSGQIIRLTARNLQQLWKNIKWRRKIIEILEVTRSFKFDCIHFRRKLPTWMDWIEVKEWK